jgi:hypothetical protein
MAGLEPDIPFLGLGLAYPFRRLDAAVASWRRVAAVLAQLSARS